MSRSDESADYAADPAAPPTPICSIGASGGGVVALQQFFERIGEDLGIAFVVVIHLSPDRPSALSEILATRTRMPVQQVTESALLRPNHVFIIPPDRELVIRGDLVAARPFTEPRGRRLPIDVFFQSAAAGRGDGFAVVLSGSGSDGALGARAVKEAGGVVFVQDPNEAEYPMMPRSALAAGAADFVAPIAQLTRRIAEVARSKDAIRAIGEADAEQQLRQIIGFLRTRTGHDFSSYKRATVMRRVARRMQVKRQDNLAGYYNFLRDSPEEAQELFSDLLISITSFFRDRGAFTALAEKAIPQLFDRLEGDAAIRVWVVGCATGEEAYSLGILLMEEAARRTFRPEIQIFATDLDEGALATAREGRYIKAMVADVSEERLHRFFVEEGPHWRVRKELRDIVLFANHSALKDPPFIRLDLIACRNLLIYMQRDLQRQLCSLFHYALRPGGFLFLGSAETIEAAPGLFTVIDREARIHGANPVAERPMLTLPQLAADHRYLERAPRPERTSEWAGNVGQMHAVALEQQAPPSALVDDQYRVLHLSPTAGRYFMPSEGPFHPELPSLVRPELRVDLKLALRRALEHGEPTLTLPLPVGFNGGRHLVCIQVAPVRRQNVETIGQAIVFFIDAGPVPSSYRLPPDEDISHDEVRRLRHELTVAQDRLSSSRSEYGQATLDLRTANEELQSINEEYRSTAEELETSKEELQSTNEELHTVNTELKSKLDAISRAHNDLKNLMAATEVGTLFVDPELRIKLFTPALAEHFNITEADVGRVLSDFTHRLVYDDFERDAAEVLRTLTPVSTEVMTRDNRWLMLRLRSYRTVEDRIEGVAVTLTDITERKRAEQERELLTRELSHRVKNTLAVVQALAIQTAAESVQAYRDSFLGRLGALAQAHNALLETDWRSADLKMLIGQSLRAYMTEDAARVRIAGESLTLSPKQALGISLVLHELATNALKYGALSIASGRLDIAWDVKVASNPGRRVRLRWRECDGPPVTPPERRSFGSRLIVRATEYELDGSAVIEFAPDGLRCELLFPIG